VRRAVTALAGMAMGVCTIAVCMIAAIVVTVLQKIRRLVRC
jgi:hypothetical protein